MQSWKFILISFISGAVVGGITSTLIRSADPAGDTVPEGILVDDTQSPQSIPAEADLLKKIKEQQLEIAELKSRVSGAADPVVEEPLEDPEAAVREARREELQARMEERLSRRVDEMALALGLDEAQRQLLAEIYNQQFENFRARRRGDDVEPYNFDGALEGILTADQFEQYLETSQQEIYNRAELMATTQMVRLSQTVEMTEEQQGLVYDAVHFTAQEAMISRQTGEDYNMRDVVNERLSTILSEEQIQALQESGGIFRGGPGGGGRGFPGP
jgi:hypothetical protein